MTDAQYQICLTVLFVSVNVYPVVIFLIENFFFSPYIASELPSNLILRKIGPSILMPTLLTIWGIIVTLQGRSPTSEVIRWIWFTETLGFIGLVTSFEGLVIVRLLLGLVEGPMAPCIVCYLSGFYIRKEVSLRFASSHFQWLFILIILLQGSPSSFQPHRCVLRVDFKFAITFILLEFCSSLVHSLAF